MVELIFNYKNKKLSLDVRRLNFFQRFLGLMFRKRENAEALLFNFKKPVRYAIHSLFVFFEFLAVWLDDKNNIIDIKKIKPWKLRVVPKKKFCRLIEIPLNREYRKIVEKLNFSDGN